METSIKQFRFAWVITGILVLSGVFAVNPLRDALTMQPVQGFSLNVGWAYLLFAPVFNLLDMMTSLSISQHMAWLVFLILLTFLGFAALLKGKHPFKRYGIATFLAFIIPVTLYVIAMLLPRPMSALEIKDKQQLIAVDFHSHTQASHDANKSFTAEHNRRWHKNAGFQAAFITDHSTFEGVQAARKRNPKQAKDGVLLLDGVEVFHKGGHVLAICATKLIQNKEEYLWGEDNGRGACKPLLIQALPGPITDSDDRFRKRDILALEIHDGAPIGLEEIKHRRIWVNKAKQLNIAMVSGSDNHGWAYAANGWSILNIKGWKQMNADQLQLAISKDIREKGFDSVRVIERNMLLPANTIFEHITMPFHLLWRMLQTLSWQERISWMIWIWILNLMMIKMRQYDA